MTLLYTFSSQFDAIYANRSMQEAGIHSRLMPVPRSLSASCGTCVTLPAGEEALIPPALWTKVQADGAFLQDGPGWVPAGGTPSA